MISINNSSFPPFINMKITSDYKINGLLRYARKRKFDVVNDGSAEDDTKASFGVFRRCFAGQPIRENLRTIIFCPQISADFHRCYQ
jgi:hypothetical protein